MPSGFKKFWPLVLLALLVAVIASKGRILAPMAPLLRFLVPAALVYFAYRAAKAAFFPRPETAPGRANVGGRIPAAPIIEICAACGTEKNPGHRCQS